VLQCFIFSAFLLQYHVQFFGTGVRSCLVQRAWVKQQAIVAFEVKDTFDEARAMAHVKSKSSKNRKLWNEAVEAMRLTVDMDNETRLHHVKAIFDASVKLAGKKREEQRELKRKRNASESSMTSSNSALSTAESTEIGIMSPPPSKKLKWTDDTDGAKEDTDSALVDELQLDKPHSKFPEADRLIRAIPLSELNNHKRKLKTGFKLFHMANANSVKSNQNQGTSATGDNSGALSLEDVDKELNRRWGALSLPERRFYQDMARTLTSPKEEEDSNSLCSVEEQDGSYILDSEDEAFKV